MRTGNDRKAHVSLSADSATWGSPQAALSVRPHTPRYSTYTVRGRVSFTTFRCPTQALRNTRWYPPCTSSSSTHRAHQQFAAGVHHTLRAGVAAHVHPA